MKLKKRFLLAICSMVLLAGMLGGGGVYAQDTLLTINDYAKMNDKELAGVPQDSLTQFLNGIEKLSKNEIEKIDKPTVERVYQQWLANSKQAALDSIFDIPLAITDSLDTVTVGTNAREYYAEYGYYYLGGNSTADYTVAYNQQRSYTAVAGWGSGYAYSYTGSTFYVDGAQSGGAYVNVYAYLDAIIITSGVVDLKMIITKLTSPSDVDETTIVHVEGWLGAYYTDLCSASDYYVFQPGNYYRVTVQIETSASTFLSGAEANAMLDGRLSQWMFFDIIWV